MKIEIQYVKEAKRINEEFNKISLYLEPYEKALKENEKCLLSLKDNVVKLTNVKIPNEEKQMELLKLINSYEKQISSHENKIIPFLQGIEQLKKDSNVLYKTLKEKYKMNDDELREVLIQDISEL
jgi:hypothetical protein